MSKRFLEIIKGYFSKVEVKKKELVRDGVTIKDVKEALKEMGYFPTHGNRYSTLKFYYADAYYEVRYEDYRLDIGMYLIKDDITELSELEICEKAAAKVDDEFGIIKSKVGFKEDGTVFVMFKSSIFISSLNEFKKFFPWYFREVKDAYWWHVKYCQDIRNELAAGQTSLTEH